MLLGTRTVSGHLGFDLSCVKQVNKFPVLFYSYPLDFSVVFRKLMELS